MNAPVREPAPRAAGAGSPPAGDEQRLLARSVLWPSWGLLALLTVLCAAGVAFPRGAQYAPLLASAALFGLPHGATDHLVPARLRGRAVRPGPLLLFFALYLALAGAYLALWFAAPAAAFVAFILLTWLHWGQGDVHALLTLAGAKHLPGRPSRALTLLARGAVPMLVPLLAFPGFYRSVAGDLLGLFGPGAAGGILWAFGPAFRLFIGAGLAVLLIGSLFLGYRRAAGSAGAGAAWRVDALETLLLVAYFATVPPVLAIGLYFCLWHSTRHIARLMLLDPASAGSLRRGSIGLALARFARDAAPLTAAALPLLGGLYLAVPRAPEDLPSLVALYLVLISALTFPHVLVVTRMDAEQGLWRRTVRKNPTASPSAAARRKTRRN